MQNNIKKIREARGMTQVALAECVGFSVQTVSAAENGHTALGDSKLKKYADCLQVQPYDLITATNEGRLVRITGFVQAGHWAETWELPGDDQYDVPVPHDFSLQSYELHGAETRGSSMNLRFPEGTAIIFTNAIETQEDVEVGKYYIVEKERSDGLREATVKRLHRTDDGVLWLVPESSDPAHQEAFRVDGEEGDTVRVVGRVRYAVERF